MRFLILTVAIAAVAAPAMSDAQRNAADPAAVVPLSPYVSVFTGYRGYQDMPAADWRAQNDEMGRLGGHVGQLRPDDAAPAIGSGPAETLPNAPASPSGGHGHH
jgi:hypothetical protein